MTVDVLELRGGGVVSDLALYLIFFSLSSNHSAECLTPDNADVSNSFPF